MKVKLFTHTDLDGVGCAIVAKYAFKNIDVEYCNYDEINQKVSEYISTKLYLEYNVTCITDISVDETNADLLNYIYQNGNKVQLIDHHNTAKWLNKYEWALVDDQEVSFYTYEDYMKSSGTSMFYHHLWENNLINSESVTKFVEKVRRYDTWEWSTKFQDQHAKQLNDLLYIVGREKFINRFSDNPSIIFTDAESLILQIEQEKIDKYIESKRKQMLESELGEYKVGVVFAERYTSQLGNVLAKDNPHLDFIIMIDIGYNSVSYRGIHDHIDLGRVAKQYGGGGHPKAAGSRTASFVKEDLWKDFVTNIT